MSDLTLCPPSVAIVENWLRDLLQLAGECKVTGNVDPALSASDLDQAALSLDASVFEGATTAQRQVVFETAARKAFYQIINSTSIDDPRFVQIWNLLDVLIISGELAQSSLIIPWYLIEELIESQTTDQCRVIFDYLESRRERLLQKDFPQTQLVVLRTCNELLRRLSRAEDAAFCGRVFFFLFQAFPLGDQSSVNLRGEYHVDNVTNFEQQTTTDDTKKAAIPGSRETPASKPRTDEPDFKSITAQDPSSTPVIADGDQETADDTAQEEDKLYPVFWRLQRDFSLPTRLFEDENFEAFRTGMSDTLARFKDTSTVVQTRTAGDEPRGTKRKLGSDVETQYHRNYNPKYLTSRELFGLELSDLSFQRHILVQALILLDFMLSLSESAKKRIDTTTMARPNKSVMYQYVLSEDKQKSVTDMRASIANYLQQGPDGNFYYRMVNTVLSRDKNWSQWKMANCPPIVKDAVPPEQFLQAKAEAKKATANRRLRAKPMGALDLTFLSQSEGSRGLEGLKDRARFTGPTIEQLVKGIDTDELDMQMADGDEKQLLKTRKDSKSWRALRIASRTCLRKLDKVDLGQSLQAIFVQDVVGPAATGDQANQVNDAADEKTPEVQVV